MFKIVPLIVLNGYDYEKSTRQRDYSDNYDSYWKNCLADSGIYGLTRYQGPVGHRTKRDEHNYVNMVQLLHNYPALYALLLHRLADRRQSDFLLEELLEDNALFRGGYAIEYGSSSAIYPRCCHTLQYFHDWKRVAASPKSSRERLGIWMGHPEIVITPIGASEFEISDTIDDFCPEVEFEPFRVNRDEVVSAVESCESVLRCLKQQVPPILKILRRSWNRRIL